MNEISIKKEHIHAPFLILILFYCNFKQTVATLIFHTIILFQALTIPIDSSARTKIIHSLLISYILQVIYCLRTKTSSSTSTSAGHSGVLILLSPSGILSSRLIILSFMLPLTFIPIRIIYLSISSAVLAPYFAE